MTLLTRTRLVALSICSVIAALTSLNFKVNNVRLVNFKTQQDAVLLANGTIAPALNETAPAVRAAPNVHEAISPPIINDNTLVAELNTVTDDRDKLQSNKGLLEDRLLNQDTEIQDLRQKVKELNDELAKAVKSSDATLALGDSTGNRTRPPVVAAEEEVLQNDTDPRYQFRVDWSNAPVSTPLGKMIEANQRECHASNTDQSAQGHRFYIHKTTRRNGLGNNVHVWSQSLCNAMQREAMLVTRGEWKWSEGLPECDALWNNSNGGRRSSQLWCFFGRHESNTHCAGGQGMPTSKKDPRIVHTHGSYMPGMGKCDDFLTKHNFTVSDFRAASMEWLFQSLNPNVLQEATRQARQAFGEEGIPPAQNLVTAHIRWGDKIQEMKLVPIHKYVTSIVQMVGEDKANNKDDPLHVYASSEDPKAIVAFRGAAPNHWKIHTSGPRHPKGNIRGMISGQNGLESLGALLLSMQANYYVFTTGSNWSRLINELRKNVIDPRCGNCTVIEDLSYGEY